MTALESINVIIENQSLDDAEKIEAIRYLFRLDELFSNKKFKMEFFIRKNGKEQTLRES